MDPGRFETLLVHGRVAPGEESMAGLAEREGATMQYLPPLGQEIDPLADGRALFALRRTIRSFRPDIVHTHTAKAGFLGRSAALSHRSRPALVHTFHGHVLEGYFGPAKARFFRLLESTLAHRTDRLVGVSEATVRDLVRLGIAERARFQVIPLGLDLAKYKELGPDAGRSLRKRLNLGPGDVLAVFVGRVVPIKRLDVMLEAFAHAAGAGATLHLAVAGDGEIRGDLEAQAAALGIADRTHFLGYRCDLRPLFAAADLAVISSDNEGTPVSLIEAGAAGLPAIATDVGGVSEVVTPETGILVPPQDPVAFGMALAQLAQDPARRNAMGTAARSRLAPRHAVARLIRDVAALYEELHAVRFRQARSR